MNDDFGIDEGIRFVDGKIYSDDRGFLVSINDFNPNLYKRLYIVKNHSERFVRAWHAHKQERKAFLCLSGAFMIGLIKLTDFNNPSRNLPVSRFVISARNPGVLLVPGGFANGLMNLSPEAEVLVFSSFTLGESQGDDYRFPFDYWNVWEPNYR
jgi:dTDP-4-dehydrorhamnose 3,5-epimerase